MTINKGTRGLVGWLMLGLLGSGMTGCVGLRAQNPQQAECLTLVRELDRATAAAGCRNAAYHRSDDYPWLRSSRFWSTEPLPTEPRAQEFWLTQLEGLDAESRAGEAVCLASELGPEAERLAACRELLRPLALSEPQRLHAALQVPDDYSLLRRSLGLYPVAYPFVARGVDQAYAERRSWFERDLNSYLAVEPWLTLGPEPTTPTTSNAITALLQASRDNLLAVPLPSAEMLLELVQHFAPVVIQQQSSPVDRIGTPSWRGELLVIDPTTPTVYYYADQLRYQGETYLRLNYVFWYPARGGDVTPWLERGDLDGITIGLVLAYDGSILTAESMNNCGCYHSFFPGPRLGDPRPSDFGVDALVPQALPAIGAGERFALYLNAGWHQPVRAAALAAAAQHYRLRPYSELEALPNGVTGARNIFDADGIVAQSARVERFLFFSMGIDNVGAMRQRGHQPITLIGREHYDESDLLERNFLRP